MSMKTFLSVLFTAALFLGSPLTQAHHAFTAQYDANARKEITGVVVKVEWLNPHAYFYVDVEDPDTGDITTWACELGSPVSMMRQGWTRESLVLGDVLVVEGALSRDGHPAMSASKVVIEATGKQLFSRQQN